MSTETKKTTRKPAASKAKSNGTAKNTSGFDAKALIGQQRAFFVEGNTKSYDFRLERLRKLQEVMAMFGLTVVESKRACFR